MTEHLTFDQLCDLEDGALDVAESAAVRAHMEWCAECASRHAALSALGAASAALPREIAPPDDLWLDISGQLTPRRTLGAGFARAWNVRQLAAAAVVIAVASSSLTALVLHSRTRVQSASTPASAPGPDAPVAELPARLASAEHGYAQSVEALQRTLDERRDSLAPSTVATVERSLRIADSAIAEARTALAHDPANRALVALFASNYERKIDLLRRATELAPRT
ncbi:MAG: hypothetical protein ABI969_06020 [bacterium]